MKLNFWQWLGVILLIIGAVWWISERPKPATPPATAPITQSP